MKTNMLPNMNAAAVTLDLRTSSYSRRWAGILWLLASDLGGLGLAWYLGSQVNSQQPLDTIRLYGFTACCTILFFGLLGLYRCHDRFTGFLRLQVGLFLAFSLVALLHLGGSFFSPISREGFFGAWLGGFFLLPGLRVLLAGSVRQLRAQGHFLIPALLVCSPERAELLEPWLTGQEGRVLVPKLNSTAAEDWETLVAHALENEAREVILDNWQNPETLLLLHQNLCSEGIRLRCCQSDAARWPWGVVPQFFQGRPILEFELPALFQVRFRLKRALDLMLSGLGLLFLSPIFMILALLIQRDSGGNVFFRQTRVGVRGKLFTMYKFRSMYDDAEARRAELLSRSEACGPLFKLKEDPRITPVGRWLRHYSIDELPQLINVLIGEMSLVGPRPALPSEVEVYSTWQRQRLLVLPGITGLWQVAGRSDIRDFEDAVRCDLYYIQRWSISLDLTILWRTIWVVIAGKGAY